MSDRLLSQLTLLTLTTALFGCAGQKPAPTFVDRFDRYEGILVAYYPDGYRHWKTKQWQVLGDGGTDQATDRVARKLQSVLDQIKAGLDANVQFGYDTLPTGQALMAHENHSGYPEPRGSVWVWRDWTKPDDWRLVGKYQYAKIVGNYHISLLNRNGPSKLLDVRDPSNPYPMDFMWGLFVHPAGRWVSWSPRDRIQVGTVDAPGARLDGREIAIGVKTEWATLAHDGNYIVVSTASGDERSIQVRRWPDGELIDEIPGWFSGQWWNDAIMATRPNGRAVYLQIDKDGHLKAERLYGGRENPLDPSPSAKWFTVAIPILGEGRRIEFRRTPKAPWDERTPRLPWRTRYSNWITWPAKLHTPDEDVTSPSDE